jgi:hypothetical protein
MVSIIQNRLKYEAKKFSLISGAAPLAQDKLILIQKQDYEARIGRIANIFLFVPSLKTYYCYLSTLVDLQFFRPVSRGRDNKENVVR